MLGRRILCAALIAAIALTGGCGGADRGPIRISAIGSPPHLLNPNLRPLDPPAAMLAEASAQGLVRFDAAGEIEPALAQSWIVSDDGLRYTFRLRRAAWVDGGSRVTAAPADSASTRTTSNSFGRIAISTPSSVTRRAATSTTSPSTSIALRAPDAWKPA